MTAEMAIAPRAQTTDPRELALLKAIGFDRLAPEQRELALSIANRYDLDPMLKHLVIIDGKPFVTRDGLLWVAHRSNQLDGIEVTKPVLVDGYWECEASVYRKDMSRPFTFPGRFPKAGRNAAYAPEMAIKCAESMALRRAFNVAAATVDERHGDVAADVAEVLSQSASAPSLAERAAARAAIVVDPTPQEAASEPSVETDTAIDASMSEAETATAEPAESPGNVGSAPLAGAAVCGNASPFGDGGSCGLLPGHTGKHRRLDAAGAVTGSWPDR
jgi:hypothetical protein